MGMSMSGFGRVRECEDPRRGGYGKSRAITGGHSHGRENAGYCVRPFKVEARNEGDGLEVRDDRGNDLDLWRRGCLIVIRLGFLKRLSGQPRRSQAQAD